MEMEMNKKLKPVPADNSGKTKKKGYAYGSMVRSPMASENKMQTSMNPMQPRQQQGGITPAMGMPGMMYGGKAKKKNGY